VLIASQAELLHDGQADMWNSSKVDSDQSLHVPYEGKALASRQRLFWRVIVWDDLDEASSSEPSWFEMGLLDSSD
jgi:alpha-L-rhamnosidase